MILELAASLMLQQIVRPPASILWEYTQQDFADGGANLFSISIDSNDPIHQTVASAQTATPGTFKFDLPALVIGTHTITVQACNPTECSAPSSLSFQLVIRPPAVSGLRIGG
jgi:hypothetical protein